MWQRITAGKFGHAAWLIQGTYKPPIDGACKKEQATPEIIKLERLSRNEIGEWEVTTKLLHFSHQFTIQMRNKPKAQLHH